MGYVYFEKMCEEYGSLGMNLWLIKSRFEEVLYMTIKEIIYTQ